MTTNNGDHATPEQRLSGLGLELPAVPRPVAAYVPAVRAGALVWTSGQLPTVDGLLMATGTVGGAVDEETATQCAKQAALNALAAVRSEVGQLTAITRVVRVGVFVASARDFTRQAHVANGASELLGDVFGLRGHHARSAVGVAVLPLNSPVEVELTVEVRD